MNVVGKDLIKKILAELQGIDIDDSAAERIATTATSINKTFKPLSAQSFFDTEPAQFNRELDELAKESGPENDR